ncbi:hypothetical protein Hypma_006903 [Hypsizygus marmoreus]|uniref:Uncharacterized protein n=1 Tax=Hypsizygus marmoreus TaxID=39966 RepID=A0A369K2L5_HYPMA|nr:hypothetical protein Hypma_006903 [Hypsizygus marmoreus]
MSFRSSSPSLSSPMLPATTDNALFSCLDPRSLYRYGRTCEDAHLAVASYTRRAFDIQDLLLRYFEISECVEFRTLQATTGLLISGSSTIEFFLRRRFQKSDLDLFVEHRYAEPVGQWLMQVGYEFVSRPNQNSAYPEVLSMTMADERLSYDDPEYLGQGIAAVLTFQKVDPP